MSSIIKVKRKSDAAGAPSSLAEGEIAINLFSRKLYAGNSTGVTAIGGVGGFASEILTELLTVDGAGTGLDADKLDGQHGSYYAVAATENSRLANTNAFIATKTTESTALSRLANTNAYIATKTTESTALSRLANTNSYIANVKTIATNRLGQTATIALTGDVTASATAFSSNAASIATTIAANSVDGSQLEDNITIANNLTVSGNTHIDGNLTVEGSTTYLSTSTVYTDDGMLKLNANNAADTVDSGVYNKYIVSSTAKYAGYFRDASDSGVFKFYKDLQAEPTTTVNTGGTGYALAQVDAIIDGGTY